MVLIRGAIGRSAPLRTARPRKHSYHPAKFPLPFLAQGILEPRCAPIGHNHLPYVTVRTLVLALARP
jgi:hypothetical protein